MHFTNYASPRFGTRKKEEKSNRAELLYARDGWFVIYFGEASHPPHSNFSCQSQLSCTAYTAMEPERKKAARECGGESADRELFLGWKKSRRNWTLIPREIWARAGKLSLIATVTGAGKNNVSHRARNVARGFFLKNQLFFFFTFTFFFSWFFTFFHKLPSAVSINPVKTQSIWMVKTSVKQMKSIDFYV